MPIKPNFKEVPKVVRMFDVSFKIFMGSDTVLESVIMYSPRSSGSHDEKLSRPSHEHARI